MLTNRFAKLLRFAAGIAALGLSAGLACGTTIGVQWNDSSNGFANNPIGSSAVVGAPGYTQTNWNEPSTTDHNSGNSANWSQSNIPLIDSTGAATGVTLSFTSLGSLASQTYYTYPQPTLTSNEQLLSDSILEFGGAGGDIVFNNVPAGNYNLVVYTVTEYPSLANFSVNGAPQTYVREQNGQSFSTGGDVWATNPNDPVDPSNYLVLPASPDNTGKIDLNYVELAGTDAVVNAVQLVAVPEPTTLGLLVGGAAMTLMRRRNRTAGGLQ
jgi:hypothetical protein